MAHIEPGGRLVATFPVWSYVNFAYKFLPTREEEDAVLASLPKWARIDNFTIQAEAPGDPTMDQMRLMMQSLLASRFMLKIHFETRTEPVFALILTKPGKLGLRIRPHSQGLPCRAKWMPPPDRASPSVPPGDFMPHCGLIQAIPGPDHTVLLGARNVTLEGIAKYLSSVQDLGRPLQDETGLSGKFDFTLQWTPERKRPQASGTPAQLDLTGPNLLEALRNQLGMKLKATKAPVSVLAIDRVEPPTPN